MDDATAERRRVRVNVLFDVLKLELRLKTDRELAKTLDTLPPILCHMRKGNTDLSCLTLIRIHESGLSMRQIREALTMEFYREVVWRNKPSKGNTKKESGV